MSGVTIAAMDKLRFASIWTPGHGTMAKAMKDMEAKLEHVWCHCRLVWQRRPAKCVWHEPGSAIPVACVSARVRARGA